MPRISVVVPFHNNADVLGDCLASVAAQSFGDFEVIMVDDGSRDDGAAVAAATAAADRRFTLIQVDGGGPGFARNHGVRRARGEYLSFVDGDDMLPSHALERLLRTLEASGSDFVSGNVQRIGPSGVSASALHAKAIKTAKTGTHISRSPELFFDVSVWNKMFRRSFWDSHGLTFPEGVVWEDLQLMTKAHVLARAVDVIPDHIYYWRQRAGGERSITQSRTSIANFRDRITALLVIDEFLRLRKPRHLLRDHQRKALLNDTWLYVPDLCDTTGEYQAEFADLLRRYLATVDRRVLRGLPSTHKLAYHLVARQLLPELLRYAAWLREQPVSTVPVVRSHGRATADLPFRGNRRLAIPRRVYRTRLRELDPFVRVEDVGWQDGKLRISGCAFVPSVHIRKRLHTAKIVVLRPRQLGRPPVVVLARSFRHPEAQRWSGQQRYDYDWAGFDATISPRWFRLGGRWLTGDWEGYVLVRGHSRWRAARLHTPVSRAAERPAAREVAPGVRLAAGWHGQRLHVSLTRTAAEVRGRARRGDDATLVISDHRWSADGALTVGGSLDAAPSEPIEAVLERVDAGDTHRIPVERHGDQFAVTLPAAAMPEFGRLQPLRDGEWKLTFRVGAMSVTPGYDQDRLAAGDGRRHQFGPKLYQFTAVGRDAPVLTVGPAMSLAARGRVRRRLLRELYYPVQQRRGLRDEVAFVSFKGKQASDNPLGIAAELQRRGDTREHVWVVTDWSVPVPAGARAVLYGTEACWDALGRSAYIVSNDDMPTGYVKRPGQFYLQTWHGTPLKRIGFDLPEMKSVNGARYMAVLAEDITRWDMLLSPNPVSTPILQRAFRFDGEVLESGYPRNDLLVAGDAGAVAADVRRRIGVPPGKRVVMYAPTWRENQFYASGRYRFDLRLDLQRAWQALSDDYVILLRGHHQMADDVPAATRSGFVINVTGYPDVAELFLASDALITDYSSMMCDFAITGRPMLFFTYDLAEYRDSVRGMNIDLEREAPGPLLATSDEVIDAIGGLGAISGRYRDAYAAFVAKFCPLDDGKAGSRVCDRIFGG